MQCPLCSTIHPHRIDSDKNEEKESILACQTRRVERALKPWIAGLLPMTENRKHIAPTSMQQTVQEIRLRDKVQALVGMGKMYEQLKDHSSAMAVIQEALPLARFPAEREGIVDLIRSFGGGPR